MRIPRFFYADELSVGRTITLSPVASHHLITVLRIDSGQPVIIFNGDGHEFMGHFITSHKKLAQVAITAMQECLNESPLFIELGQAISRGEKMDYAVQKAVELGVNRIVPLFTTRCAVKFKNDRQENRLAHWQGIVTHACEQSGRCWVPDVVAPLTLAQWLSHERDGLSLVCDPNASESLRDYQKPARLTLLIGPEGGLSDDEISLAKKSGFAGLSLGPRILRTETAAVVALSLIQHLFGDL